MTHPADPAEVTAGAVEHGRDVGDPTGAWFVVETIGQVEPRGGRPGAKAVLDEEAVKVVAFEFDADDVLSHHAARHPVVIQVVRGRVELTLPGGTQELVVGRLVHLTPMVPHEVRALEPSTLTVTMLLSRTEAAHV